MRDDQKFVVAPATHFFGRPQALRQCSFDFFQHRLACSGSVGLAQLVGLVDGDPQQTENQAAVRKVLKQSLQPFFKRRLVGFHATAFACLSMRQSLQTLSGMKNDCRADVPAQPVAQRQGSRHHRHIVAQLMQGVNQASATRLRA